MHLKLEIAKSKSTKEKLINSANIGDIIFSRENRLISKLVRKLTAFDFSHVLVKVSSLHLVEAAATGIKIISTKAYVNDRAAVITSLPLPKCVDRPEFINDLLSKVNNKYDYFLFIGLILSKMLRLSRWKENILNFTNRYTCSEYISEALAASGMNFGYDTSQITPKELYYAIVQANITDPKP